jgi:hypothetical protein
MRNIIICCIVFIISSCTKVQPTPEISLGKIATSTAIERVEPVITKGPITLTLSVTEGAKYAIQLIDLKGDVKYATGFTADNNMVIKKLDYSDVNSGDYTVTLIDIFGKEYKRQITIKK